MLATSSAESTSVPNAAGPREPKVLLCADLHDLVSEVIEQTPRLLTLQDRDPDSPMRGCMHPAYWRDKSSDLADMRRQEAALAFALIWKHPYPGNSHRGDRDVLHAALRAMRFWQSQQNRDGTFDEWYKGEHGYAATSFSSYAMALALHTLGDAVPSELREKVVAALRRCGDWLTTHHDWFKTNHEAVGVGALGAIGWLLDEPRYREAASKHAAEIGKRMHDEGWSKEISGLDVGYTFLLAEYVGMHAVLNGDRELLPAISKAYRFAADFLHPNLTTGAEYGICGNPYLSRVATVILSPHEPTAAAAMRWMNRPQPAERDTTATLKDDLRLARYAYQPLLAAAIASGLLPRKDVSDRDVAQPSPLLFEREREDVWRPAAKLMAAARPAYAAWVAPCYGGFVRAAFRDGDAFAPMVADRGYVIDDGKTVSRNARYSRDTEVELADGAITMTAPLAPCKFVMPPYWARVGLRMSTATPWGPKWTRWLIDQYRARKGTALNQSAAGISGGGGAGELTRKVTLHDDHIEIVDTITARKRDLDVSQLFMVIDGSAQLEDGTMADVDRRIPVTALSPETSARSVTIRKALRFVDGRVVIAPMP